MALSFFVLPWLRFEPVSLFGLDWLAEVVPFARSLLQWLQIDNLERLLPFGRLFYRLLGVNLPGWLTLLLTGGWRFWLLIPFLATLVFLSAHLMTWIKGRYLIGRILAWILITSAVLLLLLLLYNLSTIDGLGERHFPYWSAFVLPFLGAHLSLFGPITMVVALMLLMWGGGQALVNAGASSDQSDEEDEY